MFRKNLQSAFVLTFFSLSHLVFCPLLVNAEDTKSGTQPIHWRVIWTTDPSTAATLSWSTRKKGNKHVVRYRIKGDSGKESVIAADSGRFTGGNFELYYHHARLNELKPSTTYEVEFVSDENHSAKMFFVTAADTDRDFSMFQGGDSRSDRSVRQHINELMAQGVAKTFANDNPADDILAFAHGGDYIVNGPDMKKWDEWLSDQELTCGKDGHLLPIIPARGNHDHGAPYNEVFGFPVDDTDYYAIELSPQVRFITLNSETSTGGKQAKWLEEELKASRPKDRWVLAQYHYPVYPAVKGFASTFYNWAPLFEKYNLDLGCEADGHDLKRTFPIRDGKQDPTGVVYIGEGGLGAPQRDPKMDRWYLQAPGVATKGDHVFMLTFQKDKLMGKCIRTDRTIADEFELKPRN